MNTRSAGISEIGQIAITVDDVDKSASFYGDVLGLTLLFKASPNMAFLQCGNVRIMLSRPQGAGAVGANSILYFKVPNLPEAISHLTAKGVAFIGESRLIARMPDHELWMAAFRDLDGNIHELMCEKR
ncbi:MAG TPA: VOC family protein [Opitutaceae bacterium]|nr:VOC family protein [Opitutaceae bacterium]